MPKEYELIDNIDFFKLSTIFFLIKGIDNCFNCNELFNEHFNRVITNYSVVDCIRNFKLIGIDEKYYNKLLLFKKLDDTLDEKFSNQEKVKI